MTVDGLLTVVGGREKRGWFDWGQMLGHVFYR